MTAPTHAIASANRMITPNAIAASASEPWTRHPMTSPLITMTASPTRPSSMSEPTRPAMTANRDMGSERSRSMIPSDMSLASPTVVNAALKTTVCVKIPAIRYSR
ncbi:Uncharacterised protein [Mycobacteroides abscessus subsp. abscessus]|nr:Uncharacterised protein [Mycobacteroides abscessus subsp. abscessus]